MGESAGQLIRFLRGWEGEGGARMADLAVAAEDGLTLAARAWRSHDTCELDFDPPTGPPLMPIAPGWAADLGDRLRRTPFGQGIEILRLRLPVDTSIAPHPSRDLSGGSQRTGFLISPLPDLKWNGGDLPEIQPLSHSNEATFVRKFEQIFATEALGMGGRLGLPELASRLFRGAPVEGWIGYRGFVIGNPEQPIGTFFVGPPGNSKLNFGLAGLVPAARRTRRALAAAVAVARALRNLGARALQFEIDRRNLGSLAMARRRRATPIYRVLVLSPGEG